MTIKHANYGLVALVVLLWMPAGGWAQSPWGKGGVPAALQACEDELEACLELPCAVFPGDGYSGAGLGYTEAEPPDGTFTDNNTGLMWEIKTGTPGASIDCTIDSSVCIAGHDVNYRYDWSDWRDNDDCDKDGLAFSLHLWNLNHTCGGQGGGEIAACDNDDDCTGAAIEYCGLAGHGDWRLPTVKELQSLVDYSVLPYPEDVPLVHPTLPGATAPSRYWSATSAPDYLCVMAWYVSFESGVVSPDSKPYSLHVRAVRGP